MKLVARQVEGTKSEWRMETIDHTEAIKAVSNVIMEETGALPKVVLALIEGGKQDGA